MRRTVPPTNRTRHRRRPPVTMRNASASTRADFRTRSPKSSALPFLRGAYETPRGIRAARALPRGHLRVRAQGTRPIYRPIRAVRSDHLLGSFALLDPLLQGAHRVEAVGPLAASAMSHAGHQEQAGEVGRFGGAAHRVGDTLVVADTVQRSDELVAPAVIQQELSTMPDELLEIRIGRIHAVLQLFGAGRIGVEIECSPVPVRILEDHVDRK